MWQFHDHHSFKTCNFSGPNLLGRYGSTFVTLKHMSLGKGRHHHTVYFGSSRGFDCARGMSFSITYHQPIRSAQGRCSICKLDSGLQG